MVNPIKADSPLFPTLLILSRGGERKSERGGGGEREGERARIESENGNESFALYPRYAHVLGL